MLANKKVKLPEAYLAPERFMEQPTYIKPSILYLHHRSRRLHSCSKVKLVSRRQSTGLRRTSRRRINYEKSQCFQLPFRPRKPSCTYSSECRRRRRHCRTNSAPAANQILILTDEGTANAYFLTAWRVSSKAASGELEERAKLL